MYPERYRTRAFASLEGFRMYTHYGCVGAIPTYRESADFLMYQYANSLMFQTIWSSHLFCRAAIILEVVLSLLLLYRSCPHLKN